MKSVLDKNGIEHPDPTPVEIPTRLRLPQRQVDRVREVVRREMSAAAARDGQDTFEESDDFDVDDVEWSSPYEELFEPASAPDPAPSPSPAKQPSAPGPGAPPVDPAASGVKPDVKAS